MAHRITRRLRFALVSLVVSGAAAVVVPAVASADPHTRPPQPTIDSVQKKLGNLAMRNDQLVERYNQAQNEYQARAAAADRAQRSALAARKLLDRAQAQLSESAAAEYEGGTFSSTGALLSSDSGASYLTELDTLDMLSSHNAQVVSSFTTAKRSAVAKQHRAQVLLHEATAHRNAVAKHKRLVQQHIQKYRNLLAKLNAAQRARWQAQVAPDVPQHQISQASGGLTSATPQAARIAVKFALAQVGKPYVFGAAGPDSYDCSGLTMASWNAAGVSLPHSAAEQYNYGTHISFDQLQPGDLLFFYQPIGHVAIYIGDGLMVSAPEPGENVEVIPATSFGSDYTGATRLVG